MSLCISVSAAALLAGGCMTPGPYDPARLGPFHSTRNYVGESQLPAHFRRVVLLPGAAGDVMPPENAAAIDAVFATALLKANRFEVIPLSREECRREFQAAEFSSVSALPPKFLAEIKRKYAADGVLFVDYTMFHAYRPLGLGVRAKLADIGNGRLLWNFDEVFSAADPAVANSARRQYLDSNREGVPVDLSQSILQSPSRFAGYVATEVFATLPPVYTPPPTAPATNRR